MVIYLNTDAEMESVTTELRADKRVGAIKAETKAQGYERFKVIFKDQPELVKLARVEAIPASVIIGVAHGVDRARFAEELRTKFPTADEVRADACSQEPPDRSPAPTS
ncbi:hypothetical protein [Alloactinosynnema sp. L-07]|uniref:permease-like cell division protein FtsX n=1 Tax=Alloactinosynnema sp. L-07 TaxID=1653480 RepID=UPI00065EF47C|nr:permease-like cell division protein FtsX [Alloactinosynnema sp. L-07]CRK55544.1 hypothetical protein [Alloactinosynnema sp. L-07]